MRRIVVLVLTITLLALPIVNAQTVDPKIEKARQEATKLAGDKNRAEVTMKFGDKLKGHITSVDQDSFSFIPDSSSQAKTIAFSDVDKIKKYRRISTGSWIAIGVAAAAGAVVTALLVTRICNEQAC